MKPKTIVVVETRNGWLVVDGDGAGYNHLSDFARKCWSFNSLDAAIAQIRRVLKSWKTEVATEAAEEGGDS